MLLGMRLLLIVAAAATVLAGLTSHATGKTLPLRETCKDRPAGMLWDECIQRVKHRNQAHRRKKNIRKCTRQGPPRRFCRAMVIAAERERGVPYRWAWDWRLIRIAGQESGWHHCAVNPSRRICNYRGNRAYGYGQMLRSTEKNYACRPRPSPPVDQARCLLRYTKRRYHSPQRAYETKTRTGIW